MGGSKPKAPQQTPEEKALLRAQLLSIANQDAEINARRKRIIRGQYSNFAGALKGSSGNNTLFGNSGSTGRSVVTPTTPSRASSL